MSTLPQLSIPVKDALTARGYEHNSPYEANRIPSFALPRTAACITRLKIKII